MQFLIQTMSWLLKPTKIGSSIKYLHDLSEDRVHYIRQFTIIGAEQTIWSLSLPQEDEVNVLVSVTLKIIRDLGKWDSSPSRSSRRLGNLAVRWLRQWWRLELSGKRRQEDAWGIEWLYDSDNIINCGVRFSVSTCGHRFHQILNLQKYDIALWVIMFHHMESWWHDS